MGENRLAKEYSAGGLLRFALPTIVMMIFMASYTMVDGIFVARLVNTTALSAVNIVYPFLNLVLAVGIMLGTGGSAYIAMQMGEGEEAGARENFSFLVTVAVAVSLVIAIFMQVFLDPVLRFLGANEAVWNYCWDYAQGLIWFTPVSVLQLVFQYFFVTAGRPGISLAVTMIGGAANIVLDYVFIELMGMGVSGAAIATGIGYSIPALFGLCYFILNRKGSLYLVKPRLRWRVLIKSCANGSSEMVTNLSMAVITLLFNRILMAMVGEDGVAAATIVFYAEYMLVSAFLGYASGVAPIISYRYGEQNTKQLRHVFRVSIYFVVIVSVAVFAASLLLNHNIVALFVGGRSGPVWELGVRGFFLYAFAYLFKGLNIFASSLFTALNNGKISALLSFLRTFLFIVGALLILPQIWGVDGVWLSVPVAETLALVCSIVLLVRKRHIYHYA